MPSAWRSCRSETSHGSSSENSWISHCTLAVRIIPVSIDHSSSTAAHGFCGCGQDKMIPPTMALGMIWDPIKWPWLWDVKIKVYGIRYTYHTSSLYVSSMFSYICELGKTNPINEDLSIDKSVTCLYTTSFQETLLVRCRSKFIQLCQSTSPEIFKIHMTGRLSEIQHDWVWLVRINMCRFLDESYLKTINNKNHSHRS